MDAVREDGALLIRPTKPARRRRYRCGWGRVTLHDQHASDDPAYALQAQHSRVATAYFPHPAPQHAAPPPGEQAVSLLWVRRKSRKARATTEICRPAG